MKKLTLALATTLALAAAASAHAQSQGFDVKVNLTSKCILTKPAEVVFAYESFQNADQAATGGGFTVQCTVNQPYTLALNTGTGSALGLNYSLSVPAGGTGNGLAQTYAVTGTMVKDQVGDCNVGLCSATVTGVHTLTVSF